ncbi:TauD/TfdA family dioxygenase [Thiohalobacter sp. IOR34]|uniref:TauD/TfdA family dioxygenase n=1 Tax=Thiohalobacter sp. IOR34 TaxID=3057176 RepID=UPI0025B1F425|nr:TauD/TfdA family dioxygenase [Thiohalobacter sp. IOR34]WJW74948.1 TauD/TfdA family dioxygenase [Thiohalobacter sp. IOR34]
MAAAPTHSPEAVDFDPFDLDREADYLRWRDWKQAHAPSSLADLVVEVDDPRCLSEAEFEAAMLRIRRTNMVILAAAPLGEDKSVPRLLGEQFGLCRLDHNWLADEDAITSLTVNPEGDHPDFIPYTNRPIQWHTDGYYNTLAQQIHGLLLYCVNPAAEGGENQLLDAEWLYLLLRDENPDFIRALMQPTAMTIPPRGEARPAQTGPVFSVHPEYRSLHMRYTARTRSIEWQDDATLQAAVQRIRELLDGDSPQLLSGRLESGMALVSNNVLHNRAGFEDAAEQPPRLLYRARYYDRIRGTDMTSLVRHESIL